MKGKKVTVGALCCAAWALACAGPACSEEIAAELTSRTRHVMRSLMEEYALPSLSMAISIDGEIVVAAASGPGSAIGEASRRVSLNFVLTKNEGRWEIAQQIIADIRERRSSDD